MNAYITLEKFKARQGISGTSEDGLLHDILIEASRYIENVCGRHFFTREAALVFDAPSDAREPYRDVLMLPDLLSVESVEADSAGDDSYGDTWVEGTDYVLEPRNAWPKTRLRRLPGSAYTWPSVMAGIRITGTWGYGDGASGDPWKALGATLTAASASATTVTSNNSLVVTGQTLLVGEEQMYVRQAGSANHQVERGVNGTTATEHAGVAASVAQYPTTVKQLVQVVAGEIYSLRRITGMASETIGDWTYRQEDDTRRGKRDRRILGVLIDRKVGA